MPRSRESWKILVSTGASSSAAVFSMKAGMESGLAVLSGRRLWKFADSCFTDCDLKYVWEGLLPLLGMLLVSSSVTTDLN